LPEGKELPDRKCHAMLTLTFSEKEIFNMSEQESGESKEVLVVASKVKNYIRSKSEMNTSGKVMEALTEKLRGLCDQAIENARREGRKTVMDRDVL
jgi:histone H3/H4